MERVGLDGEKTLTLSSFSKTSLMSIAILLPLAGAFLASDTNLGQLVLALALIFLVIVAPGYVLGSKIVNVSSSNLSRLTYGIIFLLSLIIIIYPFLAKFKLGSTLIFLIIIVNVVISYFNREQLLSFQKSINLKKIYLPTVFVTLLFGSWIGIQATAIPINNLDMFIVEPDVYHHMATAAEILNHGPEIVPFVAAAAIPLIYHYGSYGLGAFLTFNNLFDIVFALYRIEFILFSFLFILALYLITKEVTKDAKFGLVAVAFGLVSLWPQYPIPSDFKNPVIKPVTVSQLVASTLLIAAIGVLFRNKNLSIRFISIQTFLIFTLVAAATLSKGSTGILIVGAFFVWVIFQKIIFKNWQGLPLLGGSILGFLSVVPFVFEFRSDGENGSTLKLDFLRTYKIIAQIQISDPTRTDIILLSSAIVISMLIPVIIALFFLRYREFTLEIITLSSLITAATFIVSIFYVWGDSQWYFYFPAIPIYGILIALLFKIASNLFIGKPYIWIIILLPLILQPILLNFVLRMPYLSSLKYPLLWGFSCVLTFFFIFIYLLYKEKFKISDSFNIALISLLTIGALTGPLKLDVQPMSVGNYEHPWSITVGTSDAADHIKNNSSINTIVLTNRHCVGPEESSSCHSRIFAVSALSERRVFIEGWSYTPCPVVDPIINSFWDPAAFQLNQEVINNPTTKNTEQIRSYGVEWVLLDERRPHSKKISDFASLEFESGEVSLWKFPNVDTKKIKAKPKSC